MRIVFFLSVNRVNLYLSDSIQVLFYSERDVRSLVISLVLKAESVRVQSNHKKTHSRIVFPSSVLFLAKISCVEVVFINSEVNQGQCCTATAFIDSVNKNQYCLPLF